MREEYDPGSSIVGRYTGKTSYLENLIAEFKLRGFRVGTVKRDSHSFEMDMPGKVEVLLYIEGVDIVFTEGYKREK